MTALVSVSEVIRLLGLEPHPEGGFYRQTFSDASGPGGRPHSTLIYYLLDYGRANQWHRVDAVEVWHWYAGAPLQLKVSLDGHRVTEHRLGNDLVAGERPHHVIPGHAWQWAKSQGDWSLVGCTVAPGFQFSKLELAPAGWEPA